MATATSSARAIAAGQSAIGEMLAIEAAFRARRSLVLIAARGLLEARRQHPCNRDFSKWLRSSEYRSLDRNERACLIAIARHEGELAPFMQANDGVVCPVGLWRRARRAIGINGSGMA
jgi:hypothetical protein